jgi:hypothetical protein
MLNALGSRASEMTAFRHKILPVMTLHLNHIIKALN